MSRIKVTVDGRELELSNLDKVLYPAVGFTKGEVISYYTHIAEVMLPHLRDRPVTRIRYPNGVEAPSFFEKNAPTATPDWVRTETLPAPGSTKGATTLDYIVADDLPTLVWLANLAAIELHTPQWRVGHDPDLLVIDLDPGPPAGLVECCEVALWARDLLVADGLDPLPKTSGKKGMQMSCAISGEQGADVVSGYVRQLAELLAKRHPAKVTAVMARRHRPGKVFLDWSQNNAAKTTVTPYSLRAGATPTASAPLTWDEVAAAAWSGGAARQLRPDEVLARVADQGDLWSPLLRPGPRL
ncbi:non-homologous end-joining DNA ligase [Pilimelia columellifera]|uniref:DNA ligase D polymerase domain-containing protein n=1 Tax=Pilimelia columellifera subsp. columellifera TaxID=706583 RepID=A0ABP6A710_9ACTN